MTVLTTLNGFLLWTWGCMRSWLEIGRHIRELEVELKYQAATRRAEDERLQESITAVIASQKAGRESIYRRIDDLDRAQQKRIDDWALQLSGQINQLYAAVANAPLKVREG